MLRNLGRASLFLAAATVATASNATALSLTYGYNFSSSGNSSQTGGDNARSYTTSVDGKAIKVTATAWNATKITSGQNSGKYDYRQGWLGSYSGGLGVTSDGDDLNGNYGQHQIDNIGIVQSWFWSTAVASYDFVVLQFDTAVTLGSITRNSYGTLNSSLSGIVYDNDFAWGSLSSMVGSGIHAALPDVTNVNSAGPCSSGSVCTATSTIYSKSAADVGNASNIWLVGASMNNPDGKVDGFKLASIKAYYTLPTVTPPPPPPPPLPPAAVPEPATWAMMIVGFGLVGTGIRRRRPAMVAA